MCKNKLLGAAAVVMAVSYTHLAHITGTGIASVIIFAVGTAGIVIYELCTAFKKKNN